MSTLCQCGFMPASKCPGAWCVANKLWPGQRFSRPHHGGPDGGQRAAAGLLGRMARRGLVTQDWRPGDPRTYWRLTQQGRNTLLAELGGKA